MEFANIERDLQRAEQNNLKNPLQVDNKYEETKYRWVILALATVMMFLNGLLNNIVLPLESKLSNIYSVNSKVVNLANILSFLSFLVVNLPANHIMDRRGIRFGFIVGNLLYLIGISICCLINHGFPFLIIGNMFFAMGQPFITNIPAKIATYWFFPENRVMATSILVGTSIIGSGVGFAIPTVFVNQASEGDIAKKQIYSLYLGYAIATLVMLIANSLLMKSKPIVPPTKIDKKDQLTIKETFSKFKDDRNLWKFFTGYSLFYGTFLIFGSTSNLLIKPFGLSDLMISLSAVALILFGAVGAVISSLFIKRTRNYKFLLTVLTFTTTGTLILFALQLYILPTAALSIIVVGVIGFFVVPVIPTSYEIGCQVAFPIGQAQVTGMLNGGALIWTFIMDSILTAAIGFGTKVKTAVFFTILVIFLFTGSFLYFKANIVLKRKEFEESIDESSTPASRVVQTSPSSPIHQQIEMIAPQIGNSGEDSNRVQKYETLNEQKVA